jgi:CBS domain containing-hemolysin-like protein
METDVTTLAGQVTGLVAIVVLVLLNGFFVAAEFALVSVRATRIRELIAQGNSAAKAVRKAISEPDRFIAATQLGITLASLGIGWLGEPALAEVITHVIDLLPIPASWVNLTSHGIAVAIAFASITFMHVVVGELMPKSIALQSPESTALIVARPTLWAEVLFRPGIWALNGAGNALLRLLGFDAARGHEMVHSVEEIKMLVDTSTAQGVVAQAENEMVDAIFDLRLMRVRQIMIPRTEMAILPADATLGDVLAHQETYRYTQYPIFEESPDRIIGVVYLRDIVRELAQGHTGDPIRPFIREVIFLPETADINTALTAFRDNRQHIAIIIDEYGGTAGMLTLEDIFEEIAGEIPDQFEAHEPPVTQVGERTWLVSGLMTIEEVNEALGLALSDEYYDTIGGYVMGKLERIPQEGDEVTADGVHMRVEAVDGMRVDRLRMSIAPPDRPDDKPAESPG